MEANKQIISLVCIGKTGAGKTTLINTLINHIMKKSYHDERVIAITQQIELRNPMTKELVSRTYECNMDQFQSLQSDRLGSRASSQTTDNIYEIELEGFTLKIIDTPGLANTAGIDQDHKNIDKIVKIIREVSKINGILIVQKSTDVRLDEALKYLISEIQGMLPKGYENNIFTCLTGVVNQHKLDVYDALTEMGIPMDNMFMFENDAQVHPSHLREAAGIDPNDEDAYEDLTIVREIFWRKNRIQAIKLIAVARGIKPLEGRSVLDLRNKKKFQIQLVFDEAHRCGQLEHHKASIEARKLRNEDLKEQLQQNASYETAGVITVMKTRVVERDIQTVEEVTTDYHSIICNVCREVCHDNCGIGINDGSDIFKCCTAFGNQKTCRVCTNKSSYDKHKYSRNRLVNKSVKTPFQENYPERVSVKNVDHEMKKIYEDSQKLIKHLNIEIKLDEAEIAFYKDHIESCYRIMSYIQGMIENKAMRATHEYYEEYIAIMIKNVNSEARLTDDEKALKQ